MLFMLNILVMGKSSMLVVGKLLNGMGQHEVSMMLEIPRTTVRNV